MIQRKRVIARLVRGELSQISKDSPQGTTLDVGTGVEVGTGVDVGQDLPEVDPTMEGLGQGVTREPRPRYTTPLSSGEKATEFWKKRNQTYSKERLEKASQALDQGRKMGVPEERLRELELDWEKAKLLTQTAQSTQEAHEAQQSLGSAWQEKAMVEMAASDLEGKTQEEQEELRKQLGEVSEALRQKQHSYLEAYAKAKQNHAIMTLNLAPEDRVHSLVGAKEDIQRAQKDPSFIKAMKIQPGSASRVLFVEMQNGARAVYKPRIGSGLETQRKAKEEMQQNYDLDISRYELRDTVDDQIPEHKREMATVHLDRMLGFGVVPHSEEVDFGEGAGTAQQWVAGKTAGRDMTHFQKAAREGDIQLHMIAAIDWITGNTDRHRHNIMVGEDHQWWAIDNGLTWVDNGHYQEFTSEVVESLQGQPIDRNVLNAVKQIDDVQFIKTLLKAGMSEKIVAGALGRKRKLLEQRKWMGIGDARREIASAAVAMSYFMEQVAKVKRMPE